MNAMRFLIIGSMLLPLGLPACERGSVPGGGAPQTGNATPGAGGARGTDASAMSAMPTRSTRSTMSPAPAAWELSPSAREALSADGTYRVRWEPAGAGGIPDAEPFDVRCSVTRVDGRPLSPDATVLVDAEMPHHGHGMNLVPTVTPAGAGRFVASGLLLHMPGRWVVAIDVEEGGIAERAQWYVDIE